MSYYNLVVFVFVIFGRYENTWEHYTGLPIRKKSKIKQFHYMYNAQWDGITVKETIDKMILLSNNPWIQCIWIIIKLFIKLYIASVIVLIQIRGPTRHKKVFFLCKLLKLVTQHPNLLKHGKCSLPNIISWEPEGRYQYQKMFCGEPEGHYGCTLSMVIAPFWFSTDIQLQEDQVILWKWKRKLLSNFLRVYALFKHWPVSFLIDTFLHGNPSLEIFT